MTATATAVSAYQCSMTRSCITLGVFLFSHVDNDLEVLVSDIELVVGPAPHLHHLMLLQEWLGDCEVTVSNGCDPG